MRRHTMPERERRTGRWRSDNVTSRRFPSHKAGRSRLEAISGPVLSSDTRKSGGHSKTQTCRDREMTDVRTIAIVGGGLGGLTAAIALRQRGFDVTVYEQAGELGEIGAGIQLSPNATRV